MNNFLRDLESSIHKGFIDKEYESRGNFKPELLINNAQKDKNVLNSLLEELASCESFIFSVAFITESGLATLKSLLLDLKSKGVNGRILTSTYLYFNQPKIFRELMKLTNVDVRLTSLKGFHSKGYIFKQKTHYSLIVGSSNLTAHALKVNYEWNVKLTSHENGDIVGHFKSQFEEVWEKSALLTEDWVVEYEKEYKKNKSENQLAQVVETPSTYQVNAIHNSLEITPNKMQLAALEQIQRVRDDGRDKGLVISATGTGKTYLSAFDVRRFQPKRMLFIVHREQILNQAKDDFQRVLGGIESDFGLYVGAHRQKDKKYVFASIQTLSKPENLMQFDPTEFDYILIDEVHKAGAPSYLRVIDHFQPKFLLGMTATPERTDDFNIYELFDYNIAYEIRLQEALEEDMLCPFHYFGVTDLEMNGEMIDDATILNKLVTEERVNHILNKINYYGYSGKAVRGLMFCSRKEEAKKLSTAFNEKGLRTVALTGEDSSEERDEQINRLENGLLDYIVTVDIFNEGIDIPSINQVVMLRQTQSSIIFVQQLGRGLRKHESKEFVTIIDFIGNYQNNYLIPVALSGDQSQNKDNIRRHMKDTSYIKGVSTINFEEIAKRKIFDSINRNNLTTMKILRDAYRALKNQIGRIPHFYDFIVNHSIDPEVIGDKHENLYRFLIKMKEELPMLSNYEDKVLTMLSKEILNGKRKHEVILLEMLLNQGKVPYSDYIQMLERKECHKDDRTIESVERILNLKFFTSNNQKKYGEKPLVLRDVDGDYIFNKKIQESLKNHDFFCELVRDVVVSAKLKSKKYNHHNKLTLYEKYSRKDACKLLNWDNDESSTMYGYKTKHGTCPIFVTYHKDDEVESSVDYGDEFLSENIFKWYTRSNRTLESPEVQKIIHAYEEEIDIHIFVKKDDGEGTDFYYLGEGFPDKSTVKEGRMLDNKGTDLPVVHMHMLMEHAVENKLYRYLIEE